MCMNLLLCVFQDWKTCSVGCKFAVDSDMKADGVMGLHSESGAATILRSMESAQYYFENNVDQARRWVSTV